jgi:D-alanyl-D-alanine carboxypeptidase
MVLRGSRAAGVLLAAALATALSSTASVAASPQTDPPQTAPSRIAAASPPAPAAPSAPVDPATEDPDAPLTVAGWTTREDRTAGTPWSDTVAVPDTHGRALEVQHWSDGAWTTRRTLPLAGTGTGTELVVVQLTDHWLHAPTTLWRLHVPARGDLPEITSEVKRVTTTWRPADDPTGPTVLVTKDRAVEPEGWRPDEIAVPTMAILGKNDRLRPEAADALADLAAAAEAATGHRLVLVSGFRPAAYQGRLFARYAAEHGAARADRFSARAGHSEHQTGLAADVTQDDVPFTEFGGTASSDWVAQNGWRFGFVVRYPEGAEKITGYDPEPWHLRYVGRDLAAYLDTTGQVLEEALGATG